MGQCQGKGDAESPEATAFLGGGGGGDPSSNPTNTNFPLHFASRRGDLEKVEEILNGSGNNSLVADSVTRGVDEKGRTPLHCATLPESSHNLAVIRLLLQRDKEDPFSEGKSLLANLHDASKNTALHYAAESQQPQVISLLLEFGADPNPKDDRDNTPLHTLACSNSDAALECAKLILDSPSLSISAVDSSTNAAGRAPIHVASHGSPKLLRLFMERGVDYARPGADRWTPLMFASAAPGCSASEENLECARILLVACSPEQVNAKGGQEKTALLVASSTKMMKLIASSNNADLFSVDLYGGTVLHNAINRKSLPSVKYLCEREEIMSDKNKIVEFIFNHNIQKNILASGRGCGPSPIESALYSRLTEIVAYLLAALPQPDEWMKDDKLMSLIYSTTPTALLWRMNQHITYIPDWQGEETADADFRIIAGVGDPVEEKVQETRYLYKIKEAPKGDQELVLLHPLVQLFLGKKWQWIRPLIWTHIIIQFSWIVGYTLMVYEMYRPNCHDTGANKTETEEKGKEEEGKGHMRILTSLGIIQQEDDCSFNLTVIQSIAVVVYLLSVLVLVKECFQMMVKSWGYFRDFINFVQLGLLVAAVVNSVPAWQRSSSASDVAPWQTNLAAIGIFGAWVMLLSELDNFPKCAVYSAILKKVLRTCLKTMLFYCPLLVAFAMCFRLLTPGKGHHDYLLFSLIKVLVMMTGEFEFEDAFYGDDDTTAGPSTSYVAILGQIMFLLLIVVTTIALLNLLTGLAVADVRKLLDDAEVDRLSMQIKWMYVFDSFILLARQKLPCLDSCPSLLYRWNATSTAIPARWFWQFAKYYFNSHEFFPITYLPLDLQTRIRKVIVGVEVEEEEGQISDKFDAHSPAVELLIKNYSEELKAGILEALREQQMEKKPRCE